LLLLLFVGLLPYVARCTCDSSWFVKKAAIDLITRILSSCKLTTSAIDNVLSDEERKMIATMFAPMITEEVCDISQLSVCLEVLKNQELSVLTFSCLRLDKTQIVKRLCSLFEHLPIGLSCDRETRILEILASVSKSYGYWKEAKQDIVQLVTTQLNKSKILAAVTLAVWLLSRFVVISA